MKTLHLSIIIIFSASLILVSNTVFADNANNVEIQNIQAQPSAIKVGDTLKITATLVNNSPDPIFVSDIGSQDCEGPFFTVMFDNHVKIKNNGIACSYVAFEERLDPGKKYTGTSPGLALAYIATEAGTANATVTFPYSVKNQTDPNQSEIEKTISKSFLFTILDNNTGTKAITETVLSPLQQFKSGTPASDVKCNDSLQLILKTEDDSPACVSSTTAQILTERGWALNYTNMTGKESISLSAYQGESIETFYNNGTVVSNFTINVNINNFKPSNALLILQVYYNDGTLYKAVNVSSNMIQPDGFYKYQLTAVSDENHPPPFKVVATYNNVTTITYAPVFAHP